MPDVVARVVAVAAFRTTRVISNGETIAVEFEDAQRRFVTVLVPSSIALDVGSEIMAAAARARDQRKASG